jgi:PKD repeat protein
MNRTLRFAKRFALPALAAGVLLVLAQVVFAQPPVVPAFDVTPPAAGNNCGGTWTFTSNATDPDGDITSTDWNFGDGTTGNGSPVQHTYALPGTYTVQESVTDAAGGDDLTVDTVNAPNQNVTVTSTGSPTAVLGATPNPAQPNATITLSGASSTDPGAGGGITKYTWDLDGNNSYETDTGTTPTATVAFATAGSHTVRLKVFDSCGNSDVDSVGVFVQNTPPTASWTSSPAPGKINQAMTFNASASTDPGGSIASYTWSWGDGTPNTTTATPTTQHTFATSGQKLVTLVVTDNDGASSGGNTQLVRVNAKPTASFSATPNPSLLSSQVTFDASSSTDDTGIATYQWDFDGDGTFDATSATATATNTYATPGTFNVKLRVTDNDGDFTDLVRAQTVQVTQPSPGFSFSPANPLPGQTVTLKSSSAPSSVAGHAITDTQWDFDYSPLSDFVLAKHGGSVTTSFATPGPHTVAVKVVETGGGFAVAYKTITVNAPPKASFTVRPSKLVQGQEITFLSTSTDAEGPIAALAWDLDNDGKFDDGTGAVASTTKLKKGKHTVRLRVTDSKGATAVFATQITVGAPPPTSPPDTTKTLGFAPRSWGIKVVALYVRVPKRTTVRLLCSGHGCPSGKFLKRSGKHGAVLRFNGFRGNLHAGAKITVISSRTGSIAEYFTYKVRSGFKEPLKLKRCKAPGAKKYRSCG